MAHLEEPIQRGPDRTLLSAALAIAPAAVGVGVGLLVSDHLERKHRNTLAGSLFALGAVAVVPTVFDLVARLINGPLSRRGTERTLRRIREGGAPWEHGYGQNIEDFEAAYREAQR